MDSNNGSHGEIDRSRPVIVVGLPRSGSTYLSHLLSELRDVYVFDDLYIYQQVSALRIKGPMEDWQLRSLLEFLATKMKKQIRNYHYSEDFYMQPQCTLRDVDRREEALFRKYRGLGAGWDTVVEEWMVWWAWCHGRRRWGYKTPQDVFHLADLARCFPGVRFVFVVRDPREVMASFKYVRWQDGYRGQYHPIAYAQYWKMACRAVEKFEQSGAAPIYKVKFERMVEAPMEELNRVADFLGVKGVESLSVRSTNSSFNKSARSGITRTEGWICEKLARDAMASAGYKIEGMRPRISDMGDLVQTTGRFVKHQIWRIARFPQARVKVCGFFRQLCGWAVAERAQ